MLLLEKGFEFGIHFPALKSDSFIYMSNIENLPPELYTATAVAA
jgi:hypothetical protein